MNKLLIVAFALCALARPAAAEINVADSLEWQTVDSDLVVRGQVTQVAQRKGPGEVVFYDATVQVAETLKGSGKPSVHVGIRYMFGATPEEWRARKADLLLFLVESKRVAADDQEYTRYPYALRSVRGTGDSALELGKSQAYTSAFRVLTKETEVLAAVRAAAKSTATTSLRVDVPWNTEAMKALWSGSAVWMFVPVDAALEKLALTWLTDKSVTTRAQGVRALAHFRSDANIARLKQLLADPDFAEITRSGEPTVKRYLVRAAAHEALSKWNVPHGTQTIEEPAAKR